MTCPQCGTPLEFEENVNYVQCPVCEWSGAMVEADYEDDELSEGGEEEYA